MSTAVAVRTNNTIDVYSDKTMKINNRWNEIDKRMLKPLVSQIHN